MCDAKKNCPKRQLVAHPCVANMLHIGPIAVRKAAVLPQRIVVVTENRWMACIDEAIQIAVVASSHARREIDIGPFAWRQFAHHLDGLRELSKLPWVRLIFQMVSIDGGM